MNNGTVQSAAMVLGGQGPTTVKADATRAFEPKNVDEGFELARLLSMSGLLGKLNKPEAAFAVIAVGRELGLTAMQSIRSIHIIEGKPTLSADLIAALCKNRPDVCTYFRMVESTDKVARFETLRKGEPEPTVMSFTWDDATRAGVTGKDNWKKYPAAMLRARCITALARTVYPDLAMGLYDDASGEIEDVPRPRYEVVEQAPPPPRAAPTYPEQVLDVGAFVQLCDRVDVAENAQALNAVAAASVRAHKAGRISDKHLSTIKEAVTRKRGIIGAPKPPPSAPAAESTWAEEPVREASEAAQVHELEREPGEEG